MVEDGQRHGIEIDERHTELGHCARDCRYVYIAQLEASKVQPAVQPSSPPR